VSKNLDKDLSSIITEKIENSGFYKLQGVAPDGFKLIPIEVIEDLKEFENWKEFKHNEQWIDAQSKIYMKDKL
jgi:hypothetical protein